MHGKWKFTNRWQGLPLQNNGVDCGVYVIRVGSTAIAVQTAANVGSVCRFVLATKKAFILAPYHGPVPKVSVFLTLVLIFSF